MSTEKHQTEVSEKSLLWCTLYSNIRTLSTVQYSTVHSWHINSYKTHTVVCAISPSVQYANINWMCCFKIARMTWIYCTHERTCTVFTSIDSYFSAYSVLYTFILYLYTNMHRIYSFSYGILHTGTVQIILYLSVGDIGEDK